eukprot:CAMPEP_0113575366 /NCGR_PEP_ID=MMETSP0015_2-20120614/27653_1 /TAXON_ID=2838 /ORGANISM="Odontella" /LENGTH=434 /DNA_ID=CAMNT_0000478587 /DNA_START=31 /DNA_END=1335 /DNA_ORIENTATION=- /assembly_acc=CAM_ASM_000160
MSDSKNARIVDETIERIATNDPSLTLTSIYLNENEGIDAAACVRIAEALRGNTHLTLLRLHFKELELGDVGASALAEALKCNTTLTHLDLNDNNIGDVGASALAEALKCNTALIKLSLKYNSIGDVGVSALAEMLKCNTTLTHLDLHLNDNDIGDVGASALSEMLKSNTTLIKIILSYNSIGDVGALALAEALMYNDTLTGLELDDNDDISDIGASALVEALQSNATLTQLGLNDIDAIDTVLKRKIDRLMEINCEAKSEEEARRRKTTLRIGWMLDDEDEDEGEGGARCEAAVALALEEMRSFPEAAHREQLLSILLGSSWGRALYRRVSKYSANRGGEDVAAAVETVPRGRALYRYAAECGVYPGILMNVLRAHPSLCGSCRDIQHRLYPFMLLATLPEARTGDVMEMLLQCPSLVESAIRNPIGRGKEEGS